MVFLLIPPLLPSSNMSRNEFLIQVLENWKIFSKKGNPTSSGCLLVAYDFSLFFNPLPRARDQPEELTGEDFIDENFEINLPDECVFFVNYSVMEYILKGKGVLMEGLFKKTPIRKVNILVELQIKGPLVLED